MNLIQTAKQIARQTDNFGRRLGLGLEIENRRAVGAQPGALKDRRQKTRLPALYSVDGQSQRVVQNDVGGQALVFRSQSVNHP